MKLNIGIINATAATIGRIQEQVGNLLIITDFDRDTQLFSANLELESPSEDGVAGQMEALTILGEALSDKQIQQEHSDSGKINLNLYKPIVELEISNRTRSALRSNRIRFTGELVMKTEAEFLKLQNVGRKARNEIKDVLEDMGLAFGMKLNNFPDPEVIKKLYGDS